MHYKKTVKAFFCAAVCISGSAFAGEQPVIGLITKTDTNPFFVKMKDGAEQAAKRHNARLITAAGKVDGDNAGQVAALENMVASGAKAILITPNDAKAIIPAITRARKSGVLVIALDGPTDPQHAVDALFATDNFKAGTLIGQFARAALGGKPAKIATLDLFPGHPIGVARHNGFLAGFGAGGVNPSMRVLAKTSEVVCMADSYGDRGKGQTAMENCLQKHPDINLVYAVNEPVAAGAYKALQALGKEKSVMIVSVDGGCAGVRHIKAGVIAATAQQYPLKMAELGVQAAVEYARTGRKPSGYVDTGVTLITDRKVAGVESRDTTYGLEACWGK